MRLQLQSSRFYYNKQNWNQKLDKQDRIKNSMSNVYNSMSNVYKYIRLILI